MDGIQLPGRGRAGDVRSGRRGQILHGAVQGDAHVPGGEGRRAAHGVRQGDQRPAMDDAHGVEAGGLHLQHAHGAVIRPQLGDVHVVGGGEAAAGIHQLQKLTVGIHRESSPPPPAR